MIPKDRLFGSLIVFFYFLIYILFSNIYILKLILILPILFFILSEIFMESKFISLHYLNIFLFFFLSILSIKVNKVKITYYFYIFLVINFIFLVAKNIIDKDIFLKIIITSIYISFLAFFISLNQKQVIYLLSIVWTTDSFAYLVGKYFGKNKLTFISPKKTWEGAIGGVIFGSLISSLVFIFLFSNTSFIKAIFLGMFLSILSQIGDLFASYIKRIFNIKDFSNIIPGHGGVLDRLDSLLFISPWIFFIFN